MVSKKEWDSDFFGINIGEIHLPNKDRDLFQTSIADDSDFDVIYLFSDFRIDDLGDDQLIDIRIDLILHETKTCDNINSNIRSASQLTAFQYEKLLNLAYLSGHKSRFKKDGRFPDNSFELFYKEWLDRSLDKSFALDVFVYYHENDIVGFITIKPYDQTTMQIGLIAVDPNYQGRGIARQLIEKAMDATANANFSYLKVATQADNPIARQFYSKAGFKEIKSTYIYHLWRN